MAPVNKTEDVCLRWWGTGGAGLGAQLDFGLMGLVLADAHPMPLPVRLWHRKPEIVGLGSVAPGFEWASKHTSTTGLRCLVKASQWRFS